MIVIFPNEEDSLENLELGSGLKELMNFDDLVASEEQPTAETNGTRAGDLPRVERSLKHILDAGQSLLGKTWVWGGQDAKASILMGSRGVDLTAIANKVRAVQNTKIIAGSAKVGGNSNN